MKAGAAKEGFDHPFLDDDPQRAILRQHGHRVETDGGERQAKGTQHHGHSSSGRGWIGFCDVLPVIAIGAASRKPGVGPWAGLRQSDNGVVII